MASDLQCNDITTAIFQPEGCNIITSSTIGWTDPLNFRYISQIDLLKYSNITQINGNLDIIYNNNLQSLNGLNSLTSLNGDLYIRDIPIQSFEDLNSLRTIGGDFQIYSVDNLISLNGLNSLISVGGLFQISYNNNLQSLNGLNSLNSVNGFLEIGDNNNLQSLNGLNSLNSVNKDLYIFDNSKLTSYSGLNSLTSIRNLFLGVLSSGVARNGINCNVCNKEITSYLKSIASGNIRVECNVESFICNSSIISTIATQVLNCADDSECIVCNEPTCQFINYTKVCGNGILDNGEECDNGIDNNKTKCNYGQTNCLLCNSTCNLFNGSIIGYCGDNIVSELFGEECDNGNDDICDGCNNCTIVPIGCFVSNTTSSNTADTESTTSSNIKTSDIELGSSISDTQTKDRTTLTYNDSTQTEKLESTLKDHTFQTYDEEQINTTNRLTAFILIIFLFILL